MCTQRAGRTINMQQLPSIPYLIYQSIIEFASLLPPCFLPDFDSHSLCRYPPPRLAHSAQHLSPFRLPFVLSLTAHRLGRSYRLFACFRFSSQLPKNATKPLPLITAFIIFPFSSFSSLPSPPLLQMMHVLRGEHFHLNRLTARIKETGAGVRRRAQEDLHVEGLRTILMSRFSIIL